MKKLILLFIVFFPILALANSPERDVIFFDFHGENNLAYFTDHPLVDGAYLGVNWVEVEPQKGVFDFSSLDAEIDILNKAGKSVILRLAAYGATNGNNITPQWIKASVPVITFIDDTGEEIVIPKVWNKKFLAEYELFIKALANHYDNDIRVQRIQIGVGHIGYTNAQPSKEGSAAFISAGWTLSIWKQYIENVVDLYYSNFRNKKLSIAMTPMFIQNINLIDNLQISKKIVRYAASEKYDISFIGADPDPQIFENMGFPTLFRYLSSLNLIGIAVGFGDDWPLYGTTGNGIRTAEDSQAILDNIYNLWISTDKKYPIYLKVLRGELFATEQGSENYNQEVYNIFMDFINKIKI